MAENLKLRIRRAHELLKTHTHTHNTHIHTHTHTHTHTWMRAWLYEKVLSSFSRMKLD